MCATCGCSGHEPAPRGGHDPAHPHEHAHPDGGHDHPHPHRGLHARFAPAAARRVDLELRVLAKNDAAARRNRAWLEERGIVALNLVSSPGAGKTTLLERTIRALAPGRPIAVIEGDQETALDAERVRAAGAAAVQVNTGSGCHLDAEMVARALERLDPPRGALLLVENVGNLVCPALFDLGERAKVVVASTAEGDDKPLKYPQMFRASAVLVLNKLDLLPHVPFDRDRFVAHARRVNPALRSFEVSATRGDGLEAWFAWLRDLTPASAGGSRG